MEMKMTQLSRAAVAVVLLLLSIAMVAHAKKSKPPKIHRVKALIVVEKGAKAYIPCDTPNTARSRRHWERDGKKVEKISDRYSLNSESRAFRIYGTHLEDTGNYTCVARNKHGTDTMTVFLQVVQRPKVKLMTKTPLTIQEGTNQEIVCRSRGVPRPHLHWINNKHVKLRVNPQMTMNSTFSYVTSRFSIQERQIKDHVTESILKIDSVSHMDFGTFYCVAVNTAGKDKISLNMDVRFPPKPAQDYNAEEREAIYYYYKSDLSPPVVPSCGVLGNDLPSIEWQYNGEIVDVSRCELIQRPPMAKSFLCTLNETSLGRYQCYATNNDGRVLIREFDVKPLHRPRVPTGEVHPQHSNLLRVTVPVGQPDVPDSEYVVVTYTSDDGTSSQAVQRDLYETTADFNSEGEARLILPGLKENTRYRVSVAAKNEVGLGPAAIVDMLTNAKLPLFEDLLRIISSNTDIFKPEQTSQAVLVTESVKVDDEVDDDSNDTSVDDDDVDFEEAGVAYSVGDSPRSSSYLHGSKIGNTFLVLLAVLLFSNIGSMRYKLVDQAIIVIHGHNLLNLRSKSICITSYKLDRCKQLGDLRYVKDTSGQPLYNYYSVEENEGRVPFIRRET